MYSIAKTAAVSGIGCRLIGVEADISNGMPVFDMIGYLGADVKEANERVRTALKNAGYVLPPKRITVNFLPANVHKSGTTFDLAIACALMACLGHLPQHDFSEILILGELGIDGSLQPVEGVYPMLCDAKNAGFTKAMIPYDNLSEALYVKGMTLYPVKTLTDAVASFRGEGKRPVESSEYVQTMTPEECLCERTELSVEDASVENYDFAMVCGQESVKRSCEIAAAGMHNLLMVGPPGGGKSMIAGCLPSILPPLKEEEKEDLLKVYSVKGAFPKENARSVQDFLQKRPFRNPHHTITPAALVGGGLIPRPGEVSLAHGGVLFLDEMAEFKRSTLELLRQPMEEKKVLLHRGGTFYVFPASFLLVGAMNPCPCGFYPDRTRCNCSEPQIRRYRSKISGPLLDRMDLCCEVPVASFGEIVRESPAESSAQIAQRVMRAYEIQKKRYATEPYSYNGALTGEGVRKYCRQDEESKQLMEMAYERLHLSVRGYYKILRVARTIADLKESVTIQKEHVLEAIGYREMEWLTGEVA